MEREKGKRLVTALKKKIKDELKNELTRKGSAESDD